MQHFRNALPGDPLHVRLLNAPDEGLPLERFLISAAVVVEARDAPVADRSESGFCGNASSRRTEPPIARSHAVPAQRLACRTARWESRAARDCDRVRRHAAHSARRSPAEPAEEPSEAADSRAERLPRGR